MTRDLLRFLWALGWFGVALLAVFRAPTATLWMIALVVTECGHWLFVWPLLSLWPGWSQTRAGRAAAALGIVAAVLMLSPIVRAYRVSQRISDQLTTVFGASPDPSTSMRPLPIHESAHVYMRVCGENLSLQLYQPKVLRGRMPVVLVIHSGGWQNGSRLEMPELSRSLAALGYTVSSIDYGLAPQSQFPGPIEDIRGALAFLREHEKEWSLDLRRVVLLGRSAGAQIALSAPVANDPIKGLKGVIAFYGPNDLRLAWTIPGSRRIIDSRRLLRQYLGGSPADVPQIYDEASPLYRVGPNFPPTLMIHGGRDELVWPLHQKRLSQRLTKFSVPHVYVELPWATHGCDYFFSGPCGRISTYAIKRYLANVLPLSEG